MIEMVGKEAKVSSINRVVDANLNISDFDHRPSQVRQWFTDNVIHPVFGHLVGWADTKAVMLRATAGGVLKTASVGSGLERMESKTGVATDVESGDIAFTDVMSRIRVIANDYDMYLRTSRDGINYEDQIHIKHDVEQVFDISTQSFKVQRYDINDVVYEVEGYC